jgi:Domain of unknown function (DUF4442)
MNIVFHRTIVCNNFRKDTKSTFQNKNEWTMLILKTDNKLSKLSVQTESSFFQIFASNFKLDSSYVIFVANKILNLNKKFEKMMTANLPIAAFTPEAEKALQDFNNPWKMRFWLLTQLPSAWFMGVKIKNVTWQHAEVTLPYAWRSQNPFKSIYFAAQCAAAELSTGALAILACRGRGNVSMLVSKIEVDFTKKANQLTTFRCEDGEKVFEIVQKAIESGKPQVLTMVSVGTQANGEVVSTMKITWSFKYKA